MEVNLEGGGEGKGKGKGWGSQEVGCRRGERRRERNVGGSVERDMRKAA